MARTAVATDNFNRASLGADWAQLNTTLAGDVTVDASVKFRGQYSTQPTNQKSAARWVGAGTFTDDQYAKVKLLNPPPADFSGGANCELGVIVRASADTNGAKDFYEVACVHVSAGTTNLCKWANGTRTLLATASVSYSANDTLELEAIGTGSSTVVTAYKNGVAIAGLAYTDTSALTGGVPGVTASSAALFGDDWEGGNITAPASVLGGNVTLDDATPGGGLSSVSSSLGGAVTLDDVAPAGTLGAAPGRIRLLGVSDEWRDKGGYLLASKPCTVDVDNPATGALLARIATATDASGLIPEISHGALSQSTLYRLDVLFGTGEYGVVYRTSEAT
jgi:hypothetical protein